MSALAAAVVLNTALMVDLGMAICCCPGKLPPADTQDKTAFCFISASETLMKERSLRLFLTESVLGPPPDVSFFKIGVMMPSLLLYGLSLLAVPLPAALAAAAAATFTVTAVPEGNVFAKCLSMADTADTDWSCCWFWATSEDLFTLVEIASGILAEGAMVPN